MIPRGARAMARVTACTSLTATKGRWRSKPAAASSTRCRCSGPEPFLVVNGDIWTDFDFSRDLRWQPGAHAHLVLVPNPPHIRAGTSGSIGDYIVEARARIAFTYSGIGIYTSEFFAGCEPRQVPAAARCSTRAIAARAPAGPGASRRLVRHRRPRASGRRWAGASEALGVDGSSRQTVRLPWRSCRRVRRHDPLW